MYRTLSLFLLAGGLAVDAAQWAVLIAGSNGFGTYRHQADICHAFQILKRNGVPEGNIITMFFDDIASDPSNPFPGQLFNHPSDGAGTDVYAGCKKSYTGPDVSLNNVLNVLRGNQSGIVGGSGEVLQSTSDDDVFINYSDHGGTSVVALPTGELLYADQLQAALVYMHGASMYRNVVFYMEACESGSMFAQLPSNLSIFAETAANADESSWGDYCPPEDTVNGVHLNTCLGDLYSTNWMEDSDKPHAMDETLCAQYTIVKNATTASHVCSFGDMSLTQLDVGMFQGNMTSIKPTSNASCAATSAGDNRIRQATTRTDLMSARLATISSLMARLSAVKIGSRMHAQLAAQLAQEARAAHIYSSASEQLAERIGFENGAAALAAHVDVSDWECYRAVQAAAQRVCGPHTDYTLQFSRVLAHVCERADVLDDPMQLVEAACGDALHAL